VSKILSQDEIDALLESSPHAVGSTSGGERTPKGEVVAGYNFRRPDRISKDQLRSLHFLHDRFAHNVSTSMSAFLRSVTEVSIVSVEQFAYSEFLMSLPEQTAFYAVSMEPLGGLAAIELNPGVAFTLVDRLLGGTGQTPPLTRALTEIEQNVIDSIVKLLLDSLADVWRAVVEVQFRIHARETRPQMLQVMGPNEIVILLGFDMKVGDTRGMLNLCIPASAIEEIGDKFAQGSQRTRREPSPEEASWLATNLGRVPVPVTAQIGTTIAAGDLMRLRAGDVLTLGRGTATPIDVYVGRLNRFAGRLTQNGQSVQVRLEPRARQSAGVAA
jgi:flagellar motor switch protein FliM